MRRAMICVSVMLALLQVWPMLFGHKLPSTEAAAAAPHVVTKPVATPLVVAMAVPENCAHHYRRALKTCGGQACQADATDKWDLCEATGFWSE